MNDYITQVNFDEILQNIDYKIGNIKILIDNKNIFKPVNILWGIQPRNIPTLEFLIPILQIIKFIKNGFQITVLLADIHELLDSPHLTLKIIENRNNAYKYLINILVELFDINSNNIQYIYGSSFQSSHDYIMDIYKISSLTSIQETYNAREIDIKDISENIINSDRKMTTMLYPILQSLDEKYTKCDIFYGSITQKPMCEYSRRLMSKFNDNKKEVIYLLQDLTKKIDISFFDPLDTIENKINYLSQENIEYLNTNILFPLLKYKNDIFTFNDICFDDNIKFKQYCEYNNITYDEIKKIVSHYLSKHLDKFYDTLISSNFVQYFSQGWLGISSI